VRAALGIAVSNGTAALQLTLACIGLKPGDDVVLPAFTIVWCALAVIYNGGVPVLVDSDPRTWCMDVERVKEKSIRIHARLCRCISTAIR
jgi:perosamine synthetase